MYARVYTHFHHERVTELSEVEGRGFMDYDRLGRKRRPEQDRGLRPIHPVLPSEWTSKAIRVAMSQRDWERFEGLREEWAAGSSGPSQVPSQARANGEVISRLMESVPEQAPPPRPLDWLDWERQKTLRLLRSAV